MVSSESEEGWQGFLKLCSKTDKIELLSQLFDLLFTFEEKETLSSRYVIIKLLLENKLTQREISEKYKVSIAQITRGSNALKIISPQLRQQLVAAVCDKTKLD